MIRFMLTASAFLLKYMKAIYLFDEGATININLHSYHSIKFLILTSHKKADLLI